MRPAPATSRRIALNSTDPFAGVARMRRLALIFFLGACSFSGGMVAALLAPRLAPAVQAQTPDRPPPSTSDLAHTSDRFEAVARTVSPAVVAVEATKPPSGTAAATGKGRPVEESGSGVLIRADGRRGTLVLTNNHVIAQAPSNQITVSLADGRI